MTDDHYNPAAMVTLRLAAATFDDLQRVRIITGNRLGAAERAVAPLSPELTADIMNAARTAENKARLMLARTYRQHVSPAVRAWQVDTRGVGEHLLALLLAEVGDPFVAEPRTIDGDPDGDPYERTLADLFAYCGLVPGRKRRRGMTEAEARASGNPTAKRTLRLLAEAQMKLNGPLRPLYDSERAKADGKGWTPAHGHSHALRIVAKRLLRDLWRVRRAEVRAAERVTLVAA